MRYLDFVLDTVDTLWEQQSMRISGNPYPSSPLCLTITSLTNRGYLSMGASTGTSLPAYWFPEKTPDERATRMDLCIWRVLEKLTSITGDPSHAAAVRGFADTFSVYGFDPRSGLAYWGQEAEFDVVLLGPGTNWGRWGPRYKPADDVPREIMWRHAPEKMARMSRAAYYGLITDAERMDYNRFCPYGFDDSAGALSMEWDAGHRAFATTGAWLIEDWVDHHCRTGDAETLDWARRMTAKWAAVQNPETGLLSHFFGSAGPEQTTMAAQPYCDVGDSYTGATLLRTGVRLAAQGGDAALAEQLQDMGQRLLTGLARFAYDDRSGLFHHWLRLADGAESVETLCYHFRTQEQKDHYVRTNPHLEDVEVFEGFGFYRGGVGSDGTFLPLPLHTARAAALTGDPCLLERAVFFADRIMEAAGDLDGPFNSEGQWTYDATASYIQVMLILCELTGEGQYLERARTLADRELNALARPPGEHLPEWWRMPYRNSLLDVLLELHVATQTP